MRTLHFSITPLAGAPIRLVRALQAHTQIEARHVVLMPKAYGARTFDTDLVWDRDRDLVLDLLERSDVVHLHHYFDLAENPFGIDFGMWRRGSRQIIRQIHSHPIHIANSTGLPVEKIIFPEVPQLVIAQFHERYYPYAHVVPNIVPIDDELYRPAPEVQGHEQVTAFFAPSVDTPAWSQPDPARRWDTKGFPETAALLTKLAHRIPELRVQIVRNVPHAECMALRRVCQVSIDEMITGSYHLASLESLAQGLPTFAYLDARMLSIMMELTSCSSLPWLNYRLEDAAPAIERLVREPELRRAIGRNARLWMERHWQPQALVRHYVDAYALLLDEPGRYRVPRFDPADWWATWQARGRDDATWVSRASQQRA